MDKSLNKYGICVWLLNRDKPNVVLDDKYDNFEKLSPQGKVFRINKEIGDYFDVQYGAENRFKVLKEMIEEIDYPCLDIGQTVSVLNKAEAIVTDCYWHFKQKEPIYLLSFNGKLLSRRYFTTDFL